MGDVPLLFLGQGLGPGCINGLAVPGQVFIWSRTLFVATALAINDSTAIDLDCFIYKFFTKRGIWTSHGKAPGIRLQEATGIVNESLRVTTVLEHAFPQQSQGEGAA
jgi:hypothetical protein